MKKKYLIKLLLISFLIFQNSEGSAQRLPFWNEIQEFKKSDSVEKAEQNAILFIGSSSFRLWKEVHNVFRNHTIINRGFGGSSLPDVIQYAEDIIFPYSPKQIVIYCGENDVAASDTVTGELVLKRFQQLFHLIRSRLAEVPIVFVSIKPSPSRWHLKEKMEAANALIKKFLREQKNTAFVDVWKEMLNDNGEPREELFLNDKLHMNEKGYSIWQKKIKPVLKR